MLKLKLLIILIPLLVSCDLNTQLSNNQASNPSDQFSNNPTNNQYYIVEGSIYDGDTFRVINPQKEEVKIRLCGIDAPEKDQPLGIESRDYLRSLLNRGDGSVTLNIADKDRYGRTVAEVFVPISQEEEIAVNGEMLLAGMAYDYKQYSGSCPNGHLYEGLEKQAKTKKIGVWSNPNNIPPWEYRRNKK